MIPTSVSAYDAKGSETYDIAALESDDRLPGARPPSTNHRTAHCFAPHGKDYVSLDGSSRSRSTDRAGLPFDGTPRRPAVGASAVFSRGAASTYSGDPPASTLDSATRRRRRVVRRNLRRCRSWNQVQLDGVTTRVTLNPLALQHRPEELGRRAWPACSNVVQPQMDPSSANWQHMPRSQMCWQRSSLAARAATAVLWAGGDQSPERILPTGSFPSSLTVDAEHLSQCRFS